MPRAALSSEQIDSFRRDLCRVATRRFAQDGYAGVTMRGLAAELGCSPMTPYRYFSNKEEIFAAVRAAAFGRLADAAEAGVAGVDGAGRRLRVLGRVYLGFAREEPHAYRIMFELGQPPQMPSSPELAAPELRAMKAIGDGVVAAVREGALAGDPAVLVHLFWAGLHGLAALELAGKLRGPGIEELAEPMIDNLMRGAAPAEAGA